MQEFKEKRAGKIPESIGMKGGFYDRFNVADPDEKKEEEKDSKGKKSKEAKKKEAKPAKGKKGKEKEEKKKNPVEELGTSEVVKKFDM